MHKLFWIINRTFVINCFKYLSQSTNNFLNIEFSDTRIKSEDLRVLETNRVMSSSSL